MTERSHPFKVGLFVLATGGLSMALVLFALKSRAARGEVTYSIRFEENVKGLLVGSPVNFQGIKVGNVSDVRFDRGQTRVTISVDGELCSIQTTTTARIDRTFVTGQATIELEGYDPAGKLLEPGGTIQATASVAALVTKTLPEALDSFVSTLEEFRRAGMAARLFLSEQNALTMSDLLKETRTAIVDLRRDVSRLTDVVERDVGRLARETSDTVVENRQAVASTLAASERTLNALTHVSDRLSTFIGPLVADSDLAHMTHDLRAALGAVERGGVELSLTMAENRERLRQALSEFAVVLNELHGLAREIRSSPSALVFGRNPVERVIPDPRPK